MKGKVILPWCLGNQLWQWYPNTSGHICRPAFEVELTSLLTTTRGDLQVKEQRATRVSIEASALRLDENFLFHRKLIAVIAVAPTGKASFVYSYVQTRLMDQYNAKWPLSLVYVIKPLITAIRAIPVTIPPLGWRTVPEISELLSMWEGKMINLSESKDWVNV